MSREVARTLSPREAAILRLASEGQTDLEISRSLEIAEGTIGTYWGRIRTKLGPYSRPELVAIAIRTELTMRIAELEEQHEFLKRELEAATAAEYVYEKIVDAADEGVLIISTKGFIEHANPCAAGLFGFRVDELIGRDLGRLIPRRFRVSHIHHVEEFLTSPCKRRMNEHSDTVGLTKSSREIPLYVAISAVEREGEFKLVAWIRRRQR
ncbi:MAG TPA: LuxR C-terminal-related transcriptional regulator [Fimbriimonadaceae bacterium]|nr:LuxR C-terminal-related transcriptional regulator [Fimbriimonadaceae bacterium]